MAIDLSAEYPGQVDTTTDPAGYPQGQPRNVVVDGDGTGTPFEARWMSDLWGFLQALLSRVSATATGNPDKVGVSQYLDAIESLIGENRVTVPYAIEALVNSRRSFDTSGQLGFTLNHAAMSPDGTKLYVQQQNNTLFQYTMSVPFDVTTAVYDTVSFSANAQDTTGRSFEFKPDGTALYIAGATGNAVYQYTLGTPWDLNTASYASKSASTSGQTSTTRCVRFKSDGTAMFVLGTTEATIFEYTIGTPWDLATASYASRSLAVPTAETAPISFDFGDSGRVLWVHGTVTDAIHEIILSTAWDITTDEETGRSYSMLHLGTTVEAIQFENDGNLMIACASQAVHEHHSVYVGERG